MKKSKSQQKRATKPHRKPSGDSVPRLRVKKDASLPAIYAAARKAFTAADLQKYAEIEEGVPARQVLAELEAIDLQDAEKRKSRAKHERRR